MDVLEHSQYPLKYEAIESPNRSSGSYIAEWLQSLHANCFVFVFYRNHSGGHSTV